LIGPKCGRLADVGSGAGFPGLVIKIVRPAMEVFLIEPNLRKSVFLNEVSSALELNGLSVIRGMVGAGIPKLEIPQLDWITSRGLVVRQEILNFSSTALSEGGKILFWTNAQGLTKIQVDKNWAWSNSTLLHGTKERFIAVGQRRA